MTPSPKTSTGEKIRDPNPKKSQKKEVVSSTSRDSTEKLIDERFDCMYGFVLFPKEMKIWVRNRIYLQAQRPRFTANISQSLLELRINELLYPYQSLSNYLGMLAHSDMAKLVLNKLWNEPCRAKDIIDFFDIRVVDGFPHHKRWLYRFLATLVKYNLLKFRIVGDRESDNIPETTIRMPKIFYLEGIHSESWMEELVIQFVRRDARQYPRKKKKPKIEEIIEEIVKPKVTEFIQPRRRATDRIAKMKTLDKERDRYERSD